MGDPLDPDASPGALPLPPPRTGCCLALGVSFFPPQTRFPRGGESGRERLRLESRTLRTAPPVSADSGGPRERHCRCCGGWRCATSPSCSSPFPLILPHPSPGRPPLSPPRPTEPRWLTLPGTPEGTPADLPVGLIPPAPRFPPPSDESTRTNTGRSWLGGETRPSPADCYAPIPSRCAPAVARSPSRCAAALRSARRALRTGREQGRGRQSSGGARAAQRWAQGSGRGSLGAFRPSGTAGSGEMQVPARLSQPVQ